MSTAFCTRLVKKVWVEKRILTWFSRDQRSPYQLVASIQRQKPKINSQITPVITPVGGAMIMDTADVVKDRIIYYNDEDTAIKAKDAILAGEWCFKCGHPSQCKKRFKQYPSSLKL